MSNRTQYDYVIVGAGPSGLTLAWCLAKQGNTVLIIDREKDIGGCHRVRRAGSLDLFTEHGPRVYNSAYLSTYNLLKQMNIQPDRLFIPYKFSIRNLVLQEIFPKMSYGEIFSLIAAFFKLMISDHSSKKTTVLEFMTENNFKQETMLSFDRICRMTDGAGAERYTLYELLQTVNQHLFYYLQQPRYPNDKGLFKQWHHQLLSTGRVQFLMNSEVIKINSQYQMQNPNQQRDSKIVSLLIRDYNGDQDSGEWYQPSEIYGKNFIMAVPLTNLIQILSNSNQAIQNSFGDYHQLVKFTNASEYVPYIPITFHWSRKLNIPSIWGFPVGDWDVVSILLSDYINDFNSPASKTVLSTAIANTERVSQYTGKTANQSSREELIDEALRQLRLRYQNLPDPELSVISPGIYRIGNKENGRWLTKDKAFILTKQGFFKDQHSGLFSNLYNVGPHNGYSPYSFTAMESAVTNSLFLFHQLYPDQKSNFPIIYPYTITGLVKSVGTVLLLILGYYLFIKYRRSI